MKYNCIKKYLNDLKRNEPLWIVGQSGEKFTMSVSSDFSVSSRPVVGTTLCLEKSGSLQLVSNNNFKS